LVNLFLLIIATFVVVWIPLRRWWMARTPPRTKTLFLLNPLDKSNEKLATEIRIPAGRRIVLYLSTRCRDNRKYVNPFMTFEFSEGYEIVFEALYDEIDFGKKLSRQGRGAASCRLDMVLRKEGADHPLLVPIVLTTPKANQSSELRVTFSSEGIEKRTPQTLKLYTSLNDFSQDARFFEPRQFGGR
jgi:hypothetical protein